MGDPKAFLNIPRQEAGYRPIHERITDFSQVEQTLNSHDRKLQASRCMDCGVPFCHWACPLGNKDPEFHPPACKAGGQGFDSLILHSRSVFRSAFIDTIKEMRNKYTDYQ